MGLCLSLEKGGFCFRNLCWFACCQDANTTKNHSWLGTNSFKTANLERPHVGLYKSARNQTADVSAGPWSTTPHFSNWHWGWLRGAFVCRVSVKRSLQVLWPANHIPPPHHCCAVCVCMCVTLHMLRVTCAQPGVCNSSAVIQPAPRQCDSATCCPFKPHLKMFRACS